MINPKHEAVMNVVKNGRKSGLTMGQIARAMKGATKLASDRADNEMQFLLYTLGLLSTYTTDINSKSWKWIKA